MSGKGACANHDLQASDLLFIRLFHLLRRSVRAVNWYLRDDIDYVIQGGADTLCGLDLHVDTFWPGQLVETWETVNEEDVRTAVPQSRDSSYLPKVDKLTPRPLFFTPHQGRAGSGQSHRFKKTVPASSSLENMLKASAES